MLLNILQLLRRCGRILSESCPASSMQSPPRRVPLKERFRVCQTAQRRMNDKSDLQEDGSTILGCSRGYFKYGRDSQKPSPASPEATQPGPLHNLVTTMFPARKSKWLREGEKLLVIKAVRVGSYLSFCQRVGYPTPYSNLDWVG